VDSCRQLHKNGHAEARYPWHRPHYHDVVYTNQDARIRNGRLILPHGQSGTLYIRLPNTITLPGRLMEVRLSYGVVCLICEVADTPRLEQTVIGVDLGVIYPMGKPRGLQLAQNDKAAASGLMTEARQSRSPAANAPSGAYVQHFTLATLPASNARMFGWGGALCKPLSPTSRGA
jgi:hypothetical protein